MRIETTACLALLLAFAGRAHAERAPTRYFDLVNASHDSVTALAVAPADEDRYSDIALGPPLRGGVTSTTVEIPDGPCLRDLRVVYDDGRVLRYPGIDVCRHPGLRLTRRDGRTPQQKAERAVARTP